MSPERVSAKEVARLLRGLQVSLKERGVEPQNMHVQLESDLLSSLDVPPQRFIQWADQKLGLKLILLDWREQARQIYASCIDPQSSQNQVVLSIAETQTIFIFGQKQLLNFDLTKQASLAYGLDHLFLENPFDVIDVALASTEAKSRLWTGLPSSILDTAKNYAIRLAYHPIDQALVQLEVFRRPGSLAINAKGLEQELLQWYLSQPGLNFIRQHCQNQDALLNPEQARTLIKRIIFLSQIIKLLGSEKLPFGRNQKPTRVIFDELARTQIERHAAMFGSKLAEQYQQQAPILQQAFKQLFPNQSLQSRVKAKNSIIDKLTRKAKRLTAPSYRMRDLNEAAALISDGLGFCLVLEDCSRFRIEQICDAMIQAVKADRLQILELKNYRGTGSQALPYFIEEDIACILRAIQNHPGHPVCQIQDGVQAIKKSGYTTAQFILMFKNPETQVFDLSPCELQIRGQAVQQLYTIEHWIRDIHLGKRHTLNDRELTPEYATLFNVVSKMDDLQYQILRTYLNDAYIYCRQLESHLEAVLPEKPKILPDACDLSPVLNQADVSKTLVF